jgi:site-specific DNA recombinase
MPAASKRAAIYVRISQDRGGAGLGVARQEKDCRALCKKKEWRVAEVYSDNDVSAYSGKPRPAYERMIADIEAGAIDAVVVWHVDRLTRSPRQLEDVIDLADRHQLSLATVTGEVDLATPTGRMVARIMGAAARQEAEHKGERQARAARQAAEAGKPRGGGLRAYGYTVDGLEAVESEADVVREAARRILAGESLGSMCRELNARGTPTAGGGRWTTTTLRRVLISARISGRREYTPRSRGYRGARQSLGEVVADAVWPAIINPTDSDRLRQMLTRPERRTNATGRTYLLSGILRCGHCGAGLGGRTKGDIARYVCPAGPGKTACGRLSTIARPTDNYVRDLVLVALESPDLVRRLHAQDDVPPDLVRAVDADETRLAELAEAYGLGEITAPEWRAAREPLTARLDANRATLARASRATALDGFTGHYDDLRARWDELDTGARRALIAAVLDHVTVKPATRRPKWDADRFDPAWRA